MLKEQRDLLVGEIRKHGLTISEYCEKVGMSRSTFTRKANEKEKPLFDCEDMDRFCLALGLQPIIKPEDSQLVARIFLKRA